MKKLAILSFAALALIACGNSYEAKTVKLNTETDSLNYALGVVNGAQIKQYYLQNDSSKETVNEFIDALTEAYENKAGEVSRVEQTGKNIGSFVRECETKGLAENEAWAINEKIFFQGLVNGIHADTELMDGMQAREYFQSKYYEAAESKEKAENSKVVRAKCGTKVATIALENELDSINYAFGYLNGEGIGQNLLAEDSTGNDFKELVKAINKGMKDKKRNPQLVQIATQIGSAIREQEAEGLLGMSQISTDFNLIRQGFINGMLNYTEQMSMQEAGDYLNATIDRIKFGEVKAEGEAFLAENALREEVVVTESGLQYEVLKQGKGKRPTKDDKVRVHYHGTLIDGTVFDSSVDRGESIVFGVTQVIPGWTEALQLMPVGSKYKLYIPQELGYGERQAGSIPPYSTLIFEVELLGIE